MLYLAKSACVAFELNGGSVNLDELERDIGYGVRKQLEEHRDELLKELAPKCKLFLPNEVIINFTGIIPAKDSIMSFDDKKYIVDRVEYECSNAYYDYYTVDPKEYRLDKVFIYLKEQ